MKFCFSIIVFLFFQTSLYATFNLNPQTKIVLLSSKQTDKNSATILNSYIKKITSYQLPITNNKDSTNAIILLTKDQLHLLNKNSKINKLNSLKDDGFIISINNNTIYIAGTNERGLLYAIYYFLEKYLNTLFLSKEFEVIPKQANISLKNVYDIQEPRFEYREIFSKESDDITYAIKNRLNGRFGHRAKDIQNSAFFIKIYNNFVATNLVNIAKFKCNNQIDFLEKKAQNVAINSIKEIIHSQNISKNSIIFLEQNDVLTYCNNIPIGKNPSYTTTIYAKNIANKLKDRQILIQAYQWSRKPPKKFIKLPKNLGIFYSTIEANFSKPLKDKENRAILNDLKGWGRFSDNIYIWHYLTNYSGYLQPFANILALDQDIKTFAKDKNIKGVFLQGSYESEKGEFSNLKTWVFSKLLWNPELDIKELIKKFCDNYYGDASNDVQKYIYTLDKITKQTNSSLFVKTSANEKYLDEKYLLQLEKILLDGLKKIKNQPIYKKHLLEVFSGIDYVRILKGTDNVTRDRSKDRFIEFLKNSPSLTHYAEGKSIDDLKPFLNIQRAFAKEPKIVKKLKQNIEWFDFQEYSLKLCCNKIVYDENASDKISAMMRGNQSDWGFQLDSSSLPKGKWDIYSSIKVVLHKDISFIDNARIALFYGIYPSFEKKFKLITQIPNNRYHVIKLGTISSNSNTTIWISPPNNNIVKSLFVDRIFITKSSLK